MPDYWLACVGIRIYLAGTRALLAGSKRVPALVRTPLLLATFQLGRLHHVLSPHEYLWLVTGWVVVCAALATRLSREDEDADLERYLSGHRPVDRRAARAG
jgi:hypothetical protein